MLSSLLYHRTKITLKLDFLGSPEQISYLHNQLRIQTRVSFLAGNLNNTSVKLGKFYLKILRWSYSYTSTKNSYFSSVFRTYKIKGDNRTVSSGKNVEFKRY